MPDGETLYDRVDHAIQRGEVWRAKEILRGNIRVRGYNVDLYERYGGLLLDTGEMSEAGKYLFLSGRRSPKYAEAISVYLKRHIPNPEHMYFSFPRAARLNDIDEYPEEVRRTLESFDFPVALDGRLYALRRWREHGERERADERDPMPRWPFFSYISILSSPLWPRGPRKVYLYRTDHPSLPVRVISVLVNLLLLGCLAMGVWVVVEWLARRIL